MKDDSRLLTDLVGALIDRAPIDWRALGTRVHAPDAARLIESLHAVDDIRRHETRALASTNPHPLASHAAGVIAIVAALETIAGLALVLSSPASISNAGVPVSQLVLAVAFATAGGILAATATRDPRQVFLLAAFFCIASIFTRGALLRAHADVAGALFRMVSLKVFVPACVWQFVLDFPRVHRFTRFDVWGRRVAAAAWAAGATALLLNVLRIVDLEDSLFWHGFSMSVLPAVCAIFIRSRRAPHPERVRVGRLALALVAGGLPFLLHALARTLSPAFNTWLSTAPARDRFWLDLPVIVGLMTSPIFSTTALIVDRPFEPGATLWRIRRTRTLSARRLARAVERVTAACGPRETAFVLERELRSGIGATRTGLLTPQHNGAFADRARLFAPLESDDAVHAVVAGSTAATDVSPAGALFELLPATDRDWITANDVALLASLRRRTGEIAAFVAVGPQRGGQPYGPDDRTFVTALAAAAGLAWDADRAPRAVPHDQPAYECETCGVLSDTADQPCDCGGPIVVAALPRHLAGKFIVERRIGRGGAGVVYCAHDVTIERDVALKTLPTLQRGRGARLADEARTMASLRHEGLATIYGLEIWREVPILVMEYFPDGTLARRLTAGPLSAQDTIDLGITLAATLAYLHGRGLLHRDIKPSNIAFATNGSPVLLDFGLATWLESRRSRSLAGTPAYLPPEAFHGTPASAAFDLWSLAVVLVECMSEHNLLKTPALAETLTRALDPDATNRFITAVQFRAAIETARFV